MDTIIDSNQADVALVRRQVPSSFPSGSGYALVQVTFRNGAAGTVDLGARLTSDHAIVSQSTTTEDAIVSIIACPQLFATLSGFNGQGDVLITVKEV